MIYRGKFAKDILNSTLKNLKSNYSKGYFFEDKTWVAFDNSTKNCWVEEFSSEEMAICWLENFFEISDIENFESFKINDELIFIPNIGYLKLNIEKERLMPKFYPLSSN